MPVCIVSSSKELKDTTIWYESIWKRGFILKGTESHYEHHYVLLPNVVSSSKRLKECLSVKLLIVCIIVSSWKELKLETGKLSIPLRMKPATNAPSGAIPLRFQFLWGWNEYHGSCRSKHIENELSIPLRMKCNELSVHPEQVMHFQFLWGWNPLPDEIINLTTNDDFQFLWGWNKITITNQRQVRGFQFLWGWNDYFRAYFINFLKFNFQFLWGWNI